MSNGDFSMASIIKYIESFPEKMYRNLEYGTIYYVAGTDTPALNQYVQQEHAGHVARRINQDARNWVTCKIVYLDSDNPLFPSHKEAALYSAMLSSGDLFAQDYSFLVALLENCEPEHVIDAFDNFFTTLQRMFDDVLDDGNYKTDYLGEAYLGWNGPMFSISTKEDKSEASQENIRFSISGRKRGAELTGADITSVSRGFDGNLKDLISQIREQQERPAANLRPSRLVITEYQYRFMLPDYNREIKFGAQIKTLYVLFLLHPEGIRMQEISDYKQEFTMLYRLFTNRSDMDGLIIKIERLLDVLNPNALNVKKSQCKKALQEAIPEDYLRQYYEIEVHRGEAHTIILDRSLVSYPETLRRMMKK